MGAHEFVDGAGAEFERFGHFHFAGDQRGDAGVVTGLERGGHDEGGQEQRQRDHHRIGRCGLKADGRAQERQHDHDPGEAGDHHEDGGGQSKDGDERDQLHRALGQRRLVAEVD